MLQNYFGAINNVTINNNLLVGGSYPVYVQGNLRASAPVTNVIVPNNDVGLAMGRRRAGPLTSLVPLLPYRATSLVVPLYQLLPVCLCRR